MTMKYTKDHEWVREQDQVYVVGISDYAQEQLGEIVFVELPEKGSTVTRGEEAAVVESVKAASDVKSPLSGSVIETNPKIEDAPELVNDDPQGEGWFYKITADNPNELADLMDADQYKEFIESLG